MFDCSCCYLIPFAGPYKCRAIGQDPLLLLANRATIRQFDIATNRLKIDLDFGPVYIT